HHQPSDAERIERAQKGSHGAAVLHASAATARDQGSPPGGHARAALQLAQGDFRAIRARHTAQRGLARLAWRLDPAVRLRQGLHCGKRGHRPDQRRRGVLVARLSRESNAGYAYRATPLRGTRTEIGSEGKRFDLSHRRDAQAFGAAARAARAAVHGASAYDLAGARLADPDAAAAVAWLFVGRLVAGLGALCRTRRCRPMAAKRRGNLRPPETRARSVHTDARVLADG